MSRGTTDPELLLAWRERRDEDAFGELVRRHAGLVEGLARRRLDDPGLAPDVAMRAFALLAQRPERASGDRLAGWLAAVATNLAETENRAARRRSARERRAFEDARPLPSAMTPQTRDLAARLDDAVLRLRADEREALLLHAAEGLTYAEVAARTGVSEDAARMRANRAMERVRRRLGVGPAAFAVWRESFPPASDPRALAARALAAPPAVGAGGGGAALGWLLMTTQQKIVLGALGALLLLGGGAAVRSYAAAPSAGPRIALSDLAFAEGKWKGKLTFVVRRTGRKTMMDADATIRPESGILRFWIGYGDPDWATAARVSVTGGGRKILVEEKQDKDLYTVTGKAQNRIVMERFVDEPGRPYDQRVTLSRDGDRLSYRTDERLNRTGPWIFANEYALERVR